MSLIKSINTQISLDEHILESYLSDFFDTKGILIQESLQTFILGAKELIDTLEAESENQVNGEATPEENKKLETFANILAGLEYFRQKNIGQIEKRAIEAVLDDKNVTAYIKKMGVEKAEDVVTQIKSHFYKGKILRRQGLDKMIEDLRKFYMSKKANVGPLLSVTAIQD